MFQRAREISKEKQASKLPEARENAGDQVVIGFNFESDWLRGRREFCGPITGSKTKTILDDFRLPLLPSPNQAKSRLFFDVKPPK